MPLLTFPHTLANDTLADADQVMADLNAIRTLVNGQLDSSNIAAGVIVTSLLGDGSVTSAKIADGTIATGDIADGAVTSAKIADGTVATADLADGAVTSAKIADGTIATGDIADDAVTSAKIATDAVGTLEIAAGAVGSSELADLAVDEPALTDAVARALGITRSGSTRLRGSETISTEESTSSTSFTALTTPGPTVTLDIPSHNGTGLLLAFIRVDIQAVSAGGEVDLQQAGVSLSGGTLLREPSVTYETRTAIPGSDTGITSNRGGLLAFPAPAAGTYNYRLVYRALAAGPCNFKNRRLSLIFIQF